jgi:AhpD family alkylhydroperoxidase
LLGKCGGEAHFCVADLIRQSAEFYRRRGLIRCADLDRYNEREELMKSLFVSLALTMVLASVPIQRANAQGAPEWMKQTFPAEALNPAWEEYKAVNNPKGALDGKTKELIGLAVAAQIPCSYCVYGHTAMAKKLGATDAQIKEAIAAAALTRKWSTVLNGSAYDSQKFQQQIDAAVATQ